MSLDRQMTRYFDYMRPRQQNPTYKSSNVGVTLGTSRLANQSVKNNYESMKTSHKQTQEQPTVQIRNASVKVQKDNTPVMKNRSNSQLSNYGTHSLSSLPKVLNERDIYQKQQKRYNIISMQPKVMKETIKKYPKFHLQNHDQNFYKKLQLQDQYKFQK